MKIYNYIMTVTTILTSWVVTGCTDSDKWEPGPQDTNIGVSAYFELPSTTDYIFGSNYSPEEMKIDVEVTRCYTENEATVGITMMTQSEGISCPASVTFPVGADKASFSIDCSRIPKGIRCDFTILLAPDQTDIYGPGLDQITFSAIMADWILLSENVRYLYSDTSYDPMYPETHGQMYQLEGTHLFMLTDFFGSGLDITFKCDSGDENGTESIPFTPLSNADFEYVSDSDKADNGWYLYDSATSDWPVWIPGDVEDYPYISYLLLYASTDYSGIKMLYDKSNLYGYIWLTVGVGLDTGDFKWGYYQVDFNMLYNPFK